MRTIFTSIFIIFYIAIGATTWREFFSDRFSAWRKRKSYTNLVSLSRGFLASLMWPVTAMIAVAHIISFRRPKNPPRETPFHSM